MTQNERIINYLDEFGSITPIDAMRDLGIMRLASRIHEVKEIGKSQGFTITDELVKSQNRWGEPTCFKRYSIKRKEN